MHRIGWGLLAPSPFCAKVELYLRMVGLAYEPRPTLSTSDAPRKKLPWIEDGAERIADSENILAHLRTKAGDPLGEAALPADRAALHHLVRRTVEESLYFVLVAERWSDPEVHRAYAADLLRPMPAPARPLVDLMVSRMLRRQLWEQGTGRHPLDEAIGRGVRDLDAVELALGEAAYFGGEGPAAIDAAVWGSLANLWYIPVETRLKAALAEKPRLVAWLERVTERWELKKIAAS